MKSLILVCFLSYILGSIPFGYIIGKVFKKVDVREKGSKNIGATNVTRTIGITYGIIVLILDVMKGIIAVNLFSQIYVNEIWMIDIELVKMLSGISVVLGHMFSIFLLFEGGKGVATSAGVFLSIAPYIFLISFVIFIIIFLITKYVSASSIAMVLTFTFLLILFQLDKFYIYSTAFIALLIIIKHIPNIKRIINKSELKLNI
jgi:glycerol-3-phosphate acyltransferase PlsY